MSDQVRRVTIQLKVEPSQKVELPDWAQAAGGAAQYFEEVNEGLRGQAQAAPQAATAIDGVDKSMEAMVEGLATMLDNGGVWSEMAVQVRELAETIVDSMDALSPDDRAAAIEEIMNNARAQYEAGAIQIGESSDEMADTIVQGNERMGASSSNMQEKFNKNLTGAVNSMIGASAAAGQLLNSIAMLGDQSESIEELARRFVHFNATMGLLSSGSSLFGQLSGGLDKLQKASKAADDTIKALGGATTMTTSALSALGPVATSMQAALGPIGVALTAVAAGYALAQAAQAFFGEDAEETARILEAGMLRYNEELQTAAALLDANTARMQFQQSLVEAQIRAADTLAGGQKDAMTIQEEYFQRTQKNQNQLQQSMKDAANQAEQGMSEEHKATLVDARQKLKDAELSVESETDRLIYTDDPVEKRTQGKLKQAERDLRDRREELDQLEEIMGITDLKAIQGAKGASEQEYMEMINLLPEKMYDAFSKSIKESIDQKQSSATAAFNDTGRQIATTDRELDAAERKRESLKSDFTDEFARTERMKKLQEDDMLTGEFSTLRENIEGGSTSEGLNALSPYLSADRQKELRTQASEGTLTQEQLLAEITDLLEIDTEREELDTQLGELEKQTELLREAKQQLMNAQQAYSAELRELVEQIGQVSNAARQ